MQPNTRMTIRFEQSKPLIKPINQPPQLKARREQLDLDGQLERAAEAKSEPMQDNEANLEDFTAWISPYQDELPGFEPIIRKTHTDLDQSLNAPLTLPILADHPVQSPDHKRHLEAAKDSTNSHNGPSWGRVFLSVTSAIATGALFGYLILSLFTGEALLPVGGKASTEIPAQASPMRIDSQPPTSEVIGGETPKVTPHTASQTVVPSENYYLLQYGVFQNDVSMQGAINQLNKLGLVYKVEQREGYRVYVGTALNRNTAELIAAQLGDIEVYIKAVEAPEMTMPSELVAVGGAEYLTLAAEMVRMLAQNSSHYLLDQHPQPLEEADVKALEEGYRNWSSRSEVRAKLGTSGQIEGKRLEEAVSAAQASMMDYHRSPTRFHLWKAQSETMQAMISYRNLCLTLQSSS